MTSGDNLPTLSPSEIGRASKYGFSPRFIKLTFDSTEPIKDRSWIKTTEPRGIIQPEVGNEFEEYVYEKIRKKATSVVENWFDWEDRKNTEQIIDNIRSIYNTNNKNDNIVLLQSRLHGNINKFKIVGDSDLIVLSINDNGVVDIDIFDIKSTWEEKPSQQLQTAVYAILMDQMISKINIPYNINTGIIYRETDISEIFSNPPEFDIETRKGDIKRILEDDGPFDKAFKKDFDSLDITSDFSSPYGEVDVVDSLEKDGLSLLELSQGEKNKLKSHKEINNIFDVAKLYEPITNPKPTEYEEPNINPEYKSVVKELKEDGLSKEIYIICQNAQSVLGSLGVDIDHAHDKPWLLSIRGSGSAQIPDDDPSYIGELPIPRKSLIRVYLDVQYDNVRDSLLSISGHIDCSLIDDGPFEFSASVNNLERNPDNWGVYEIEMMKTALDEMFNVINMIGDLAGKKRMPVHFYIYSQNEYEKLYERLIKNETENELISSMRSLFDKREAIDQKMVSIIEPEIQSRFAKKSPNTTIHNIVNKMYPGEDEYNIPDDLWSYNYNNQNINLKDVFEKGVFEGYLPVQVNENKEDINIQNKVDEKTSDVEKFYNILPNSGSNIPIEYFWGSKEIDLLDDSWSDSKRKDSIINSYVWVDGEKKNTRMSTDVCEYLSKSFAKSLHHIERSIKYKRSDMDKEVLNLSKIKSIDSSDGTLAESCIEYLDIEAHQSKIDAFEVYQTPLEKRIIDGESLPIKINTVEDGGYMFKAKGELILDRFDFNDTIEIKKSSKIGGSDGISGGDRCVATPLVFDNDGNIKVEHDSPNKISKSIHVSVEKFNPKTGHVEIHGYKQSMSGNTRYTIFRPRWTLDDKNDEAYIGPGSIFSLDPSPDDVLGNKALHTLENPCSNSVYNDITECIDNGILPNKETKFDEGNIKSYFNWISNVCEFLPNGKQKKFIETLHRYSILQGPPGTGKTSGSVAHALLSRLFDGSKKGEKIVGGVSGLSNKSVDEVLSDTAELLEKSEDYYDDSLLDNVRLIRISSSEPEKKIDGVEYINYHSEKGQKKLEKIILAKNGSKQQTISEVGDKNPEHSIIFGTPGGFDTMIVKVFARLNMDPDDVYQKDMDIFDFVTVDEASMMPMYQLFMTTAFLKRKGQVMIVGDHRQLSPVQKYEWGEEKRKSITMNLPYLSSLDYFRYLSGSNVKTPDETPESPEVDIKITRLEKTYRCHETVTEFLRRTVYEKDGISYTSDETKQMKKPEGCNEHIQKSLDPSSPLTVIVHDDSSSQLINTVESTLMSALTEAVPNSESVGIVTPHNAQKGRLNTVCSDGDIDTVERFQGGEKDIMFLSTTVSDPSQLKDEEEFILSHQRLNVALSRMKKKLVVIVPKTVFNLIPNDTDTYNEAIVWKSLYAYAVEENDPVFSGTVGKFIGNENMDVPGSSANIEVFNFRSFEEMNQ